MTNENQTHAPKVFPRPVGGSGEVKTSEKGGLASTSEASTPGPGSASALSAALLTGGDDKPYTLGLASALMEQGVFLDVIGSDGIDAPQFHGTPFVNFLNLRGDQREDVGFGKKASRLLKYYLRLLYYAAIAKPPIFHILWNNKFEKLDRTVLMLYYRMFGRKIAFTAHNVNAGKRDSNDSFINRLSLRIQYGLAHHIFVHTARMKKELAAEFDVMEGKISVIPFGINNTLPCTDLTTAKAKEMLGLGSGEKAMLFFGQIAPYKGLEYLVDAFSNAAHGGGETRLIIAGKVKKGCDDYWGGIRDQIKNRKLEGRIIMRISHIPDEDVETYFKAADVLVLPYVEIFQSGVPFLAYSFGLPVIAADAGSLRDDVIEGQTGYMCRVRDSLDLARAIGTYFTSDLYKELETRRQQIRDSANERYSWKKVGDITRNVYAQLMKS